MPLHHDVVGVTINEVQGFAECLRCAGRNNNQTEMVAHIESAVTEMGRRGGERNGAQTVAIGKGISLHGEYAGRKVDVVQSVAVIEGITANLLNR